MIPGERGQMFAAYRLLIGAIMALMMLVIIMGGITYIESIKYQISLDRLFQGAENAVRTPNRDVVVVEDATFQKGTSFSTRAFAEAMGIQADCITLYSGTSAFEVGGDTVTAAQNVMVNVYIRCDLTCPDEPGIGCEISFGKGFED